MSTVTESLTSNNIREIPLVDIALGTYRLRRVRPATDDPHVQRLATSIKEQGLLQPIVVVQTNGQYELVAGEHRYTACKFLGHETILATVYGDAASALIAAFAENGVRKQFDLLEECRALKIIIDQTQCTQAELADKIGMSRPYVANKTRLLSLPDDLFNPSRKLTEGHLVALLHVRFVLEERWKDSPKSEGQMQQAVMDVCKTLGVFDTSVSLTVQNLRDKITEWDGRKSRAQRQKEEEDDRRQKEQQARQEQSERDTAAWRASGNQQESQTDTKSARASEQQESKAHIRVAIPEPPASDVFDEFFKKVNVLRPYSGDGCEHAFVQTALDAQKNTITNNGQYETVKLIVSGLRKASKDFLEYAKGLETLLAKCPAELQKANWDSMTPNQPDIPLPAPSNTTTPLKERIRATVAFDAKDIPAPDAEFVDAVNARQVLAGDVIFCLRGKYIPQVFAVTKLTAQRMNVGGVGQSGFPIVGSCFLRVWSIRAIRFATQDDLQLVADYEAAEATKSSGMKKAPVSLTESADIDAAQDIAKQILAGPAKGERNHNKNSDELLYWWSPNKVRVRITQIITGEDAHRRRENFWIRVTNIIWEHGWDGNQVHRNGRREAFIFKHRDPKVKNRTRDSYPITDMTPVTEIGPTPADPRYSKRKPQQKKAAKKKHAKVTA